MYTKTDLKRFDKIYSMGYGGDMLVNGLQKEGYNSGLSGWNWDIYRLDNIGILRAYRNIPASARIVQYDIVEKYNKLAKGKTNIEKVSLIKDMIQETDRRFNGV